MWCSRLGLDSKVDWQKKQLNLVEAALEESESLLVERRRRSTDLDLDLGPML
jgi:hypothetical protein